MQTCTVYLHPAARLGINGIFRLRRQAQAAGCAFVSTTERWLNRQPGNGGHAA